MEMKTRAKTKAEAPSNNLKNETKKPKMKIETSTSKRIKAKSPRVLLTPEEKQQRKILARKKYRDKLTPGKVKEYQEKQREYHRQRRMNMTPEERLLETMKYSRRRSEKVKNMTPEERAEFQRESSEKDRKRTENLSEEAKEILREKSKFRMMVQRSLWSEERKAKEAERLRNFEKKLTPDQLKARRGMMKCSRRKHSSRKMLRKRLEDSGHFSPEEIQLRVDVLQVRMEHLEKTQGDPGSFILKGRGKKAVLDPFFESLLDPAKKFTLERGGSSNPPPTESLSFSILSPSTWQSDAYYNEDYDELQPDYIPFDDYENEDFINSHSTRISGDEDIHSSTGEDSNVRIPDLDTDHEYICSECRSKFFSEDGLQTHMKLIHVQKCFGCPECPEIFTTLEEFQTHRGKCHLVEAEEVEPGVAFLQGQDFLHDDDSSAKTEVDVKLDLEEQQKIEENKKKIWRRNRKQKWEENGNLTELQKTRKLKSQRYYESWAAKNRENLLAKKRFYEATKKIEQEVENENGLKRRKKLTPEQKMTNDYISGRKRNLRKKLEKISNDANERIMTPEAIQHKVKELGAELESRRHEFEARYKQRLNNDNNNDKYIDLPSKHGAHGHDSRIDPLTGEKLSFNKKRGCYCKKPLLSSDEKRRRKLESQHRYRAKWSQEQHDEVKRKQREYLKIKRAKTP